MRTGWSALVALLTMMLVLVSTPHTRARQGSSNVVFNDVRVFDGERVLPSATVTIANGAIASVTKPSREAPNATRIDGRGLTLLPGLIDAHDHTGGRRESLRDAARFGVTTIVDLFDRPERMRALRRAVTDAPSCGEANYFSAGLGATVKGGHAYFSDDQRTVMGPADAEAFVRERVADGSEYIKIVVEHGFAGKPLPTLNAATAKALIGAAHRSGKLAIVHATWPADARMVVETGADGLAHLWVSSRGEPGDDDRLVRLIKAHHV
jgi:imidazolonepropionase-like amidohydrolase